MKKPKRQNARIATWEIDEVRDRVEDTYGLVELLRCRWLQSRNRGGTGGSGPRSLRGPQVVVDEVPRGGLEEFRNIPIVIIKAIRYLNGPAAMIRYAPEYQSGALEVITRSSPP